VLESGFFMTVSVELKNESVIINGISIDDANTHKILSDIKEENREDFIKKAIVIGSIGLRNLYLTDNVDYVEKEFKELMKNFDNQSRDLVKNLDDKSRDIKDMIEKSLDVESNTSSLGKMRVLFEDYFDKRGGKISDLLSPFEDGSPIKKLRDDISKQIQELREELLKDKAKEEIMEKTTLKGGKFEEVALEEVEDYCSEYEDVVSPTGEILGRKNKIGDITIDIEGDEKKRIVIECKDAGNYSHKKTIDEINDAIENRDASFGIFLFKSQDQIPAALKPMKISKNYIVTAHTDLGLYFAVRVARIMVEKSSEGKQNEIPVAEIQKELIALNNKLDDFKSIHMKLTQIDNASNYIRKNIDRLKLDIESGLGSVKDLLNGG
jgi:hypothetical protein